MVPRNSLILAFLFLASCALAGTWIASPGKGSHAAAGGAFAPSSATWDGTDDRITFSGSSVLIGAGAGKQLTVAFWVNLDNTSTNKMILFGRNGAGGGLWRVNCNQTEVQILVQSAAPATVVSLDSDGNLVAGGWHHIMISIDTSSTSFRHIYIDGVEAMDGISTWTADSILALNKDSLHIGADEDLSGELAGCMAELWVDDTYIDLTNSANRAKFYNAGDPVDLGANGQTPTGSSPDLYMKFVSGSLAVNSGADGGTGTISGGVTNGDCGAVGN